MKTLCFPVFMYPGAFFIRPAWVIFPLAVDIGLYLRSKMLRISPLADILCPNRVGAMKIVGMKLHPKTLCDHKPVLFSNIADDIDQHRIVAMLEDPAQHINVFYFNADMSHLATSLFVSVPSLVCLSCEIRNVVVYF